MLQVHEPSCAKKLKEVMKVRHTSGGFDYYPSSATTTTSSEFRVPLPVVASASTATSTRIPTIKVTPVDNDPPTFAEAIRMASEVKEEEEQEAHYNLESYFGHSADEFFNAPQSNHFLAKRSLGQTYLDLDSRCIAL